MKTTLILFLSLIAFTAFPQTKNYTHIDEAGNVSIYNGKVNIGKIIIIQSPGTVITLTKFDQKIDTAKTHFGEYKTTFSLLGQEGTIFNKTITVYFDKPIISCDILSPNGGTGQLTTLPGQDLLAYRFVINQLTSADNVFILTIYSKEKIFTKIEGVSIVSLQ